MKYLYFFLFSIIFSSTHKVDGFKFCFRESQINIFIGIFFINFRRNTFISTIYRLFPIIHNTIRGFIKRVNHVYDVRRGREILDIGQFQKFGYEKNLISSVHPPSRNMFHINIHGGESKNTRNFIHCLVVILFGSDIPLRRICFSIHIPIGFKVFFCETEESIHCNPFTINNLVIPTFPIASRDFLQRCNKRRMDIIDSIGNMLVGHLFDVIRISFSRLPIDKEGISKPFGKSCFFLLCALFF